MTNIDDTVNWLIDGLPSVEMPLDIVVGLCERLNAAGVNVARGAIYVETLHPTVIGRRFIWEQGKEPQLDEASFAFSETLEFRSTPIQEVNATGKPLRCKLHRADCPDVFPAIAEFRSEGMTDYFALPLSLIHI